MEGVEAYGHVNFLKAGLVFADAITTVSERYAQEIRSSEEFGAGLQGVVNKRKNDLSGILNGVDYSRVGPFRRPADSAEIRGKVHRPENREQEGAPGEDGSPVQ